MRAHGRRLPEPHLLLNARHATPGHGPIQQGPPSARLVRLVTQGCILLQGLRLALTAMRTRGHQRLAPLTLPSVSCVIPGPFPQLHQSMFLLVLILECYAMRVHGAPILLAHRVMRGRGRPLQVRPWHLNVTYAMLVLGPPPLARRSPPTAYLVMLARGLPLWASQ